MSAGIVSATLRVTVSGAAGRADLVVPTWVDVATLAESWAEAVGASRVPSLTTRSGTLLDPAAAVEAVGLRHGDLVVAVDGAVPGSRAAAAAGTSGARRTPSWGAHLPLLAAGPAALGAGALLATTHAGTVARSACLVLLLLGALVAVTPWGGARAGGARARSAVAPAFGAAAGFLGVYTDAPGGLLLGLVVGGFAATVVAAFARAVLDPDHDEVAEVWLLTAGPVSLVALAVLLLGGSLHGLWALLFGAAVVGARLLPYTVVDVPDQALLDLDRLAVTAWSARERPRGSRRRRTMVRYDGVLALVHRGRLLVAAGTVAVAVVVATTGPLLVRSADPSSLVGAGSLALVALGGIGLSLVARSFRSTLPRLCLRLSALWVLAFLGVVVLADLAPHLLWWAFGLTVGLAAVVLGAAVLLGRGWRSVWWARAADVVEGLAVVLAVGVVPLASGLFDVVLGFAA